MRARSPNLNRWRLVAGFICLTGMTAAHRDRRIVDRVIVGDIRSEQDHAFAGELLTTGIKDSRVFRQTGSWMRFALTVFDDTEVTLAITFADADDMPRTFDVIVENEIVGSPTLRSRELATTEFRVPLTLTRGKTNILVVLRATRGSKTPALFEVRSVQDHNE